MYRFSDNTIDLLEFSITSVHIYFITFVHFGVFFTHMKLYTENIENNQQVGVNFQD